MKATIEAVWPEEKDIVAQKEDTELAGIIAKLRKGMFTVNVGVLF